MKPNRSKLVTLAALIGLAWLVYATFSPTPLPLQAGERPTFEKWRCPVCNYYPDLKGADSVNVLIVLRTVLPVEGDNNILAIRCPRCRTLYGIQEATR